MKVISVKSVGKKEVYDLSVDGEMYAFQNGVVSHNTGGMYASDNVYILGRQQDKEGTELTGYSFIINVEKSRYCKEKSKFSVEVSFEGGINVWTGLLEIALESGHVVKPSNGWYQKKDSDQKYRLKDTNTKEFWSDILAEQEFKDWVQKRFAVSSNSLMEVTEDRDIEEAFEEV